MLRGRYNDFQNISNMDLTTRTFFIAGVQHRPDHVTTCAHVVKRLAEPMRDQYLVLQLVGEPKNQYDRYAVKIVLPDLQTSGLLIGYVPKPINVDIWALRDAGWKPICELISFDPEASYWSMYKIRVSFEKPVGIKQTKSVPA